MPVLTITQAPVASQVVSAKDRWRPLWSNVTHPGQTIGTDQFFSAQPDLSSASRERHNDSHMDLGSDHFLSTMQPSG